MYRFVLAKPPFGDSPVQQVIGIWPAAVLAFCELTPKGRSGPIAVSTPAGTGMSTADFFVPPPPYTAAQVGATARLVVGGPTVPVSIPSGGKIALVVFEANAGVTLNLGTVTTSGYPFPAVTVYRPDGAVLPTTGSTTARYLPPLPMAGIYTVMVTVATFASTISLTLSEEVVGSAEIGGSAVNVSVPRAGQRARIAFSAAAGQRVSAGVSGSIASSTLSLRAPDDATLASASIGSSGAVDSPALASTGTHTLIIEPGNGATGTVTVTLSEEVTASITVDGSAVPVAITRAGQRARVSFSGTAGQRLGLGVTQATVSGSISLIGPGGTTLLSGAGYTTPTGGVDLPPLTATGTHEIVVDPSGVSTGEVSLLLSQEITGTLTLDGSAVPVSITRPGQRARLTFSGTASQRVSHVLSGTTINGTLSIIRPDGSTMQSAMLPWTTFLEPSSLPTTGTYAVLVDPSNGTTGSTTVASYDVPPDVTGALTINDPGIVVTISAPGQNATLTFPGTSGQAITIVGTGSTLGCITVTLIPPSGSSSAWGACTASFSVPRTLGATGTHTVKIDPNGASTGGVTVGVTSP